MPNRLISFGQLAVAAAVAAVSFLACNEFNPGELGAFDTAVSAPAPLRTRRLGNGRRMLLEPFEITVAVGGAPPQTWVVPAGYFASAGDEASADAHHGLGFTTDFSSIPTLLSWFAAWDKVDVAGVIHDYLYSAPEAEAGRVGRWRADQVWRAVAEFGPRGVSARRVRAMSVHEALQAGVVRAW